MKDIFYQKDAKELGENGCYFSSILKACEKHDKKEFDFIRTYEYCSSQKTNGKYWIEKGTCFIWHPEKIVEYLLGKKVDVRSTEDINYQPKSNEIIIGCWKNKSYQHFGLIENKQCTYDPLGVSNTIKNGSLVSLRIFTIK